MDNGDPGKKPFHTVTNRDIYNEIIELKKQQNNFVALHTGIKKELNAAKNEITINRWLIGIIITGALGTGAAVYLSFI